MKSLYLFRHAKASPWTGGADDRARTLVQRGVRDARAMGSYLAQSGAAPEVVLCSSAARAVETWEAAAQEIRDAPPARIEDGLYEATAGDLLERLHEIDDSAKSVLVVGHNPALAELAERLAGAGDTALRAELSTKFPTAAIAGLTFDALSWRELARGTGTLTLLASPKALSPKALAETSRPPRSRG